MDWAIFAGNKTMHPGDKVRLLHSKEQGIIRRLINPKIAEVEIEDGFTIPVEIRELVVVSKQEDRFFQEKPADVAKEKPAKGAPAGAVPKSRKGVCLAFLPKNDREVSLHLINNTDFRWVYAISEKRGVEERGTLHGILEAKSVQAGDAFFTAQLHNWPEWIVEIIWYQALGEERPMPTRFAFKARPKSFVNALQKAPVLHKDAYLFQLDAGEDIALSAQELKAALLGGKATETPKTDLKSSSMSIPSVVDLHIEALTPQHDALQAGEKLEMQLRHFEQSLDKALVCGMQEITFIHGVGNGTLRHQIHKQLSQRAEQLTFKDAQKEKFGYGATKVIFK